MLCFRPARDWKGQKPRDAQLSRIYIDRADVPPACCVPEIAKRGLQLTFAPTVSHIHSLKYRPAGRRVAARFDLARAPDPHSFDRRRVSGLFGELRFTLEVHYPHHSIRRHRRDDTTQVKTDRIRSFSLCATVISTAAKGQQLQVQGAGRQRRRHSA